MLRKVLLGIGAGAFVLLISGVCFVFFAWPVMVALGILHAHWHVVPAFGYLATLVILWALRIVTPFSTKVTDKGES
jgi:hypothetical protein